MKPTLSTLLAVFAIASTALADEILLRNGHKIVGIEREEKDRIVVETGYGTVSYPRDQVVSVTKGETPLHAYPVRLAEIEKSTNAADFTKLAAWARENNMPRYVGGLMTRAMELDPENAEAREALGYVRHEGKWIRKSDLKKEQGQVQEGGRWVHKLEKELEERKRIEAESRRLDRDFERRRREELRRRAQEEKDLQARIQADESARTMTALGWGRNMTARSDWGWWGGDVYDLMLVDWLLSFRSPPGFFGSPTAPPSSAQPPPRAGGKAPGFPPPVRP